MPSAIETLLAILDLEPLEHNLYRGRSPQVGWQRVFGGQVIGQALVAAAAHRRADAHAHSLHAYFMRPGDPAVPIIYEVDRIRDGKSFTTRRVVAIQHGEAIFSMSASFQIEEAGLDHQIADAATCRRRRTLPSEAELKALYRRRRARDRPPLLGARRGRSSCARSILRHYISREQLRADAAGLGARHRHAARRSATSTAASSPMPPT